MPFSPKKEKIFLVFLFFLSFAIRTFVFHFYLCKNQNYWQVDSNTYHRVAQNIAKEKGICNIDGSNHFYRLPGYPIFLAFFYKIFGPHPQKALWAQVILASFIPLLIFFLSLTLFPSAKILAYFSSLFSAFHLGFVLYSGFFMTESLFIFLLLIFFLFFFKSIHLWFCTTRPPRRNGRNVLLGGLFLGLASLVRPVGHYLIILALVLILLSNNLLREKIRLGTIFFLSWFVPVSIWLIRNYLLVGHIFFHTLPGGHFLYLSAARVVMKADNITYIQARNKLKKQVEQKIKKQEHEKGHFLNEIERCCVHEQLAIKHFLSHPLITLKTWLTDVFRTCLSLYSAELLYIDSSKKQFNYFENKRSWSSLFSRYLLPQTSNRLLKVIVYFEIIIFFLVLLGFMAGLINIILGLFTHTVHLKEYCAWLKSLPFMALFIGIALAGGYARMRLPIEPLIMIFSFNFWIKLKNIVTKEV